MQEIPLSVRIEVKDLYYMIGTLTAMGFFLWRVLRAIKIFRTEIQEAAEAKANSIELRLNEKVETLRKQEDETRATCGACKELQSREHERIVKEHDQDVDHLHEDIQEVAQTAGGVDGSLARLTDRIAEIKEKMDRLFDSHSRLGERLNQQAQDLAAIRTQLKDMKG